MIVAAEPAEPPGVYNIGENIAQRHAIKGLSDVVAGINKTVGSITDKVSR